MCLLIAGSEPTDMHPGDSKWQTVVERIRELKKNNNMYIYTIAIEPTDKKRSESSAKETVGWGDLCIEAESTALLKSLALSDYSSFVVQKNNLNKIKLSELYYHVHDTVVNEEPSEQEMVILESPSGWADVSMETNAKMIASETGSTPPLLSTPYFFGTSVIGPLHIQRGIPCQDACAYEILSSGWGVIAVADGLGSAPKSDIGAKSVVDAAIKTWKAAIAAKKKDEINYGEILREIVFSARKTLEARAIEEKCFLRELACTIIVVLTYEDTIAVAHVGDGAVVVKTNDGLKLISEPEESEYVNEVVPLTSKKWEKSLRISANVSDVECVAAFTDGCQRAALLRTQNGLQPYDRFFEPLFTYAQELDNLIYGEQDIRDLLASQKMSENSEDDKTLVVSVLRERYEVND